MGWNRHELGCWWNRWHLTDSVFISRFCNLRIYKTVWCKCAINFSLTYTNRVAITKYSLFHFRKCCQLPFEMEQLFNSHLLLFFYLWPYPQNYSRDLHLPIPIFVLATAYTKELNSLNFHAWFFSLSLSLCLFFSYITKNNNVTSVLFRQQVNWFQFQNRFNPNSFYKIT